MKLLPINNLQPMFYGLWGETRIELKGDDINPTIHNIMIYHPFKDETADEINLITGRKYKESPIIDQFIIPPVTDTESVEVYERLQFTKSDFQKYKNKLADDSLVQLIEKNLKDYKLLCYSNEYAKFEGKTYILKKLFGALKNIIKI